MQSETVTEGKEVRSRIPSAPFCEEELLAQTGKQDKSGDLQAWIEKDLVSSVTVSFTNHTTLYWTSRSPSPTSDEQTAGTDHTELPAADRVPDNSRERVDLEARCRVLQDELLLKRERLNKLLTLCTNEKKTSKAELDSLIRKWKDAGGQVLDQLTESAADRLQGGQTVSPRAILSSMHINPSLLDV